MQGFFFNFIFCPVTYSRFQILFNILSERFSRDPLGWSEEGLGKLTKQRIYIKNRGKIEARDFKDKDRGKGSYGEYAERIIEEACEGAIDFSIFERREPVFDGSSGTQTLIRSLSMNRGIPLS